MFVYSYKVIHFNLLNLIILPVVDSTNSYAQRLVSEQLAGEGTAVVAWEQTSGRGQRGSAWESQAGSGLYFSIILQPSLNASGQILLNKALSTAVCRYISDRTGFVARIKWPNDILIDGRKVCGILLEASFKGEKISSMILGCGINLNHSGFTGTYQTEPVSFKMLTGKRFDPESEAAVLYDYIWKAYKEFSELHPAIINTGYSDLLYMINKRVKFIQFDSTFDAILIDVDDAGNAVILKEGVITTVQHPVTRMLV